MDFTLGQLEGELRRLGWPEPTERSSTAFAWSAVDGGGVRHILAAWWGTEIHRVVDQVTGQASMQPTGREGVFVTGRGTVCTTLSDAVTAMMEARNVQHDLLLAMFGLRREWSLPNTPIVPMDKIYSHEERLAVLHQQGIW